MIARTLALAALIAVGGCAKDRVTLLDNEDAAADFAVADITKPDQERLIDKPLSELKLGSRSAPKQRDKIRERDAALANDLPPPVREVTITFPFGQMKIPADQRGKLEEIRLAAASRGGPQIEVAGFTDSMGESEFNRTLSEQRARAVAQELREFGLTVDPADEVGRGEFEAVKRIGDEKASEDYRKVVVIVR